MILWLTPKVGKFPREYRSTLGQRVERLLGDILEKLIRAKFTRDRRDILESVNVDLEVLVAVGGSGKRIAVSSSTAKDAK